MACSISKEGEEGGKDGDGRRGREGGGWREGYIARNEVGGGRVLL